MGQEHPWTVAWSSPGERLMVESRREPTFTRYRFRSNGPADGAVAVVTDRDRILFIEIDRPAVGQRLLELPRGQGEAEDDGPVATAARELFEETGLTLTAGTALGTLWPDSGLCGDGVEVVLAQEWSPRRSGDPEPEFPRQRWLSNAEIALGIRQGTIRDAITLGALALVRAQRP